MSKEHLVSEEIARVIDLLEQIKSVSEMIEIHHEGDRFMSNQYKHRKEDFLKELRVLLHGFAISPNDLLAA